MKLKVISVNGESKVVNEETGEELQNVASIDFQHFTGDVPSLLIQIINPEIQLDNVEGELYEN